MQILKQGFEERNLMPMVAEEIANVWRTKLTEECPQQSFESRENIISWLLGSDLKRFDDLNGKELAIAKQAMEYKYRILRQRYLGVGRERAYRNLINRLGSLVTLRNKIQTWIALSRDRQRKVLDVLQEVIQELLQSDNYMQQQMSFISALTKDARLKDALLFSSIEEYCLRPVRNQPLLSYRFVNYLRRSQRGGLTQVPSKDLIRLVSDEMIADDSDNTVSLVDTQVIAEYDEEQQLQEQTLQRQEVQEEFENYLKEHLGDYALQWLRLYLQGKTQDAIAKELNKPIKEIYRLREKISYHAVRVFALKNRTELVENWLGTSLKEHNLGLTLHQSEQLEKQITPVQKQILDLRRGGKKIDEIALQLNMKTHQVMGEWTKVYLAAQNLRAQE
ncbi:MAG: HetZ-related protein 2 [Cyanobacteria bacterium P01_A01_bin.84]